MLPGERPRSVFLGLAGDEGDHFGADQLAVRLRAADHHFDLDVLGRERSEIDADRRLEQVADADRTDVRVADLQDLDRVEAAPDALGLVRDAASAVTVGSFWSSAVAVLIWNS